MDRPKDQIYVWCKWVFKRKKRETDGEKVRYNARLVAKGFTQREWIDYTEVFSHVVRQTSIRVVMSMLARYDQKLQQMDVNSFLHGDLEDTVYMKQPKGLEEGNIKVSLLLNSLYGLKWPYILCNKSFDLFMNSIGYRRINFDNYVYLNGKSGRNHIILLLYVDDTLLAGKEMKRIEALKHQLRSEFEIKVMRNAWKILGINIIRRKQQGEVILTHTVLNYKESLRIMGWWIQS